MEAKTMAIQNHKKISRVSHLLGNNAFEYCSWLNDMAKQGYKAVKIGWITDFEETDNTDIRYNFIVSKKYNEHEKTLEKYKEAGWDYVGSFFMADIYMAESKDAKDVFKGEEATERVKTVYRKNLINRALFIIFSLIIPIDNFINGGAAAIISAMKEGNLLAILAVISLVFAIGFVLWDMFRNLSILKRYQRYVESNDSSVVISNYKLAKAVNIIAVLAIFLSGMISYIACNQLYY